MTPNPQSTVTRKDMRGADQQQSHIFSYVSPEDRVREDHPLRAIRAMVDEVLEQLSQRFDAMYSKVGRPSIPPEQLLRAQLLQMLYSIRSERLLMEEMDYNLLFRWFVGLNTDDEVWDATVFTKNRDRLLEADVAKEFLAQVVEQARAKALTSDEHFTVDGTLLEAWAGAKSFQPKDKKQPPSDDPGNPTVNFRSERWSNQTHASKTDPEARLARKSAGKESKLSYCGNLLVENRNGLIVDAEVFQANGTAERDAALIMLEKLAGRQPVTVGGDKGFDTRDFVKECRNLRVIPHVAQNHERRGGSALDGRTTRHPGYSVSQRKRKRIEECFGWLKTIALMRKVRHRGVCKVHWIFTFAWRGLQSGAHAQPGGCSSDGVSRGRRGPGRVWSETPGHSKHRKSNCSLSRKMKNKEKNTLRINFSVAR